MLTSLKRAIGTRLANYLSKALPGYLHLDTASIEDIAAALQPGDVLLVDGNTRIATAIKYLTQSSWSHACLYLGHKPLGNKAPMASKLKLLEADVKNGVHLVSLDKYVGFNLRLCRPVNLSTEDLSRLRTASSAKLGYRYDLKNVFDLLRYLIQKPVVPDRYRRAMISFGSGEPTKAICSTLIAEMFQSIAYPILPLKDLDQDSKVGGGEVPQFYRTHFTHFTPRDFDLSPYFQVVKPTIEQGFDYRKIQWLDMPQSKLKAAS